MRVSKVLGLLKPIVYEIMSKYDSARESSRVTQTKVWIRQLGGLQKCKDMSAYDFFLKYRENGEGVVLSNGADIERRYNSTQKDHINCRRTGYKGDKSLKEQGVIKKIFKSNRLS